MAVIAHGLEAELTEFAAYCRAVAADAVGTQRAVWLNRAVWADNCAATHRGTVEALDSIIAVASGSGDYSANDALGRVLDIARAATERA